MDHSPPKALLICPACDHENPPDGDWRVRDDHGRDRLDCPACGETITVRGGPVTVC
jgi:hypothetical protein